MATLDVVTFAEVSDYLSNPTNVDLAESWITAVSLRLDKLCGPIVERTLTGETCTACGNYVKLKYRPIISVSSVVEYTLTTPTTLAAETNSAKTGSDYQLDLDRGYIYRRNNGYDQNWAQGRGNIVVTYIAGRFADTASVSDQFKQAAKIIISHLWQSETGTPNPVFGQELGNPFGPSFAIPQRALEVLGLEVQPQVSVA